MNLLRTLHEDIILGIGLLKQLQAKALILYLIIIVIILI